MFVPSPGCVLDGARESHLANNKTVWMCPKNRDDTSRCPFYIWDEDAEEAKAWLLIYGPPDPDLLETPVKPVSPRERETPWTKSKRKPVSRENSDQDQNGGPSERKTDEGYVFVDDDEDGRESPSRRGPKRKRVQVAAGIGGEKIFVDRLKEASLPTPETMGKGKGKDVEVASNQAPEPSPTRGVPGSSQESRPHQDPFLDGSNLTAKVVQLLQEERVDLKESTLLQIRHEIDLEADMNAAKTKRYEGTISRLSKRLDELETMLEHLIGGDEGSMSEPIYLSD